MLELQQPEFQGRGYALRALLADLHGGVEQVEDESEQVDWPISLAQVDQGLAEHANALRTRAERISLAQLRSTIPGLVPQHRGEALALIHLLIDPLPEGELQLRRIEYMMTLLSTDADGVGRHVVLDPAALSPEIAAFCRYASTRLEGDSVDVEVQIHKLTSELEMVARPSDSKAAMRELKQRLELALFAPGIVGAVVDYNTQLSNLVCERIASSRLTDADFSAQSELNEPPRSSPVLGGREVHTLKGEREEPVAESLFDSPRMLVLMEALEHRVSGDAMGSGDAEQLVFSLDISELREHEIALIRSAAPAETDRLVAYSVLTGRLIDTLPMIEPALRELGIDPDQLSGPWLDELNAALRKRVNGLLADSRYEAGQRLSDTKTRYLYAALAERSRKRCRIVSSEPAESTPVECSPQELHDATRAAEDGIGRRSIAHRRLGRGEGGWGYPGIRRVLLALSSLVIGAMLLSSFTLSAGTEVEFLRPGDLSRASPYLKSAYRNGGGAGPMIIGRIDPEWFALDAATRRKTAEEMIDRLVVDGISEVMVYDAKTRLVIDFAGTELRRPTDPTRYVSTR